MINLEQLSGIILPVLKPYTKRVALFGSVIRGEETPESDIDILVTFSRPLGLFKWIELEQELSKRLGRKVDLVLESELKSRIRPHIEAEMVIIYEKPRRHRMAARYPRHNNAD